MSRYKDKMMGVMQEFYSYLTDDSMTNDQAIARIKEDHGESWAEYVRDEIETEEAQYETIG
jgi:hypothetical protein|tara:strand:- start:113 stop:295 length:183 start_codon:yes stop_codon:yes gene_type:complete